jgi:hypothetical protein
VCRSWHDGQLPTPYAYLSGALCGVTEGVAFAPFQVIKVRQMQLQEQQDSSSSSSSSSPTAPAAAAADCDTWRLLRGALTLATSHQVSSSSHCSGSMHCSRLVCLDRAPLPRAWHMLFFKHLQVRLTAKEHLSAGTCNCLYRCVQQPTCLV